jgi:hypothetical protein
LLFFFFFVFGVGMAVVAIAQVLLGEGYYAERSAKQAVEILERRSEFLDSKINSTKVHIGDLEAEAAFVKNIADEAAVCSLSLFLCPSISFFCCFDSWVLLLPGLFLGGSHVKSFFLDLD